MAKETRSIPKTVAGRKTLQLRMDRDTETPQAIEGYGAVFYDANVDGTEFVLWDDKWGRAVERIMPGAFDEALVGHDVRSFFNHDANIILGRRVPGRMGNTLDLGVDEFGLRYSVGYDAESNAHQDVARSISRGDVDGSSFMFYPTRETWIIEESDDDLYIETREILEVELFEVGPVVWPAYEATTSGTRSIAPAAAKELRAQRRTVRDGSNRDQFRAAIRKHELRKRMGV